MVTILTLGGMTDLASAVLATAARPQAGTAAEAWLELAHAALSLFHSTHLGEVISRARRARDIAQRADDAWAVEVADLFLWNVRVHCVSPEAGLAELSTVIATQNKATFLALFRASLEARLDEEMLALRRCMLTPDVIAAGLARSHIALELVRRNRIDKLDAELSASGPEFQAGRASAAVCGAFVSLGRGDPERALRELVQAEELARVTPMAFTWELLHACRASAFVALGRQAEAAVSVRDGLARLEYSLEGIDDDLRAGAETHVDAIRRLRALANELGIPGACNAAPR
jgi:hypothetical protein